MATHLLTGAGSGIGAAVGHRLHDRGDQLVLLARSDERAAGLARDYPGADTLVADLSDPDGLERLLADAELPDTLDSVLHVAGAVELATVKDLSLGDLREQLDVNLVAPTVLTRACLPALRRAKGTVLFVNSTSGLRANPTWAAYAASKFGLRGLADALRAEEAEYGVRVTSVFPSRTATPMQEKVHAQEGKDYDPSEWITADTVAEAVLHVLDLPPEATIPELVVRVAT
jgi:short-subunit dehydrogenase